VNEGPSRLGIAIAHPALIHVLNNAKAPYNISTPTAYLALRALSPESLRLKSNKIATLNASRAKLMQSLSAIPAIGAPIGANEANFVVVPVLDKSGKKDTDRAHAVYKTLAEEKGVVVRFRGKESGCEACLRITIGTEEENEKVIEKLKEVLAD
jgi:histidinol-phosphate aminotransferase